MPVKIGTLISNIAQKFGIATDTPDFIDLLGANLEVPDALATAFNADVFTFEAAKNNPKLKGHFYATSLNEVDRRITDGMNELGLPDEVRTEILGQQSTFDRISLYGRKIKELSAQKETATGQERTQLATQINTLQGKITELTQQAQTQTAALKQAHATEMADLILSGKISSRKLDTTAYPLEVMSGIARNFIDQALTERGIKISNQERKLLLKQSANPDLDYFHNGQAYTIDQLIDEVLAKNKLITVTDPAPLNPGSNGNSQRYTPPVQQNGNNNTVQPLNGMLGKLDKIAADMQKVNGGTV